MLLCPEQAGRGVLSTGEAYQSGFLMFHIFLVLYVVQQAHGKGDVPFRRKDTFLIENGELKIENRGVYLELLHINDVIVLHIFVKSVQY